MGVSVPNSTLRGLGCSRRADASRGGREGLLVTEEIFYGVRRGRFISCRLLLTFIEGLSGGEFAVYVRLRAWASGMEDATFPNPDATGGTRDGGQLFRCKFVNFHSDRMREAAASKQFNLAHFL
jgi:hypothetical protein